MHHKEYLLKFYNKTDKTDKKTGEYCALSTFNRAELFKKRETIIADHLKLLALHDCHIFPAPLPQFLAQAQKHPIGRGLALICAYGRTYQNQAWHLYQKVLCHKERLHHSAMKHQLIGFIAKIKETLVPLMQAIKSRPAMDGLSSHKMLIIFKNIEDDLRDEKNSFWPTFIKGESFKDHRGTEENVWSYIPMESSFWCSRLPNQIITLCFLLLGLFEDDQGPIHMDQILPYPFMDNGLLYPFALDDHWYDAAKRGWDLRGKILSNEETEKDGHISHTHGLIWTQEQAEQDKVMHFFQKNPFAHYDGYVFSLLVPWQGYAFGGTRSPSVHQPDVLAALMETRQSWLQAPFKPEDCTSFIARIYADVPDAQLDSAALFALSNRRLEAFLPLCLNIHPEQAVGEEIDLMESASFFHPVEHPILGDICVIRSNITEENPLGSGGHALFFLGYQDECNPEKGFYGFDLTRDIERPTVPYPGREGFRIHLWKDELNKRGVQILWIRKNLK